MHSGKVIPLGGFLKGFGMIIDFLKVTKSNILPPPLSNKRKQKLSTCMVAITAYI